MFESSVISYGSKTTEYTYQSPVKFESSVISYGSKTFYVSQRIATLFESSVISYGSKTDGYECDFYMSLRVV